MVGGLVNCFRRGVVSKKHIYNLYKEDKAFIQTVWPLASCFLSIYHLCPLFLFSLRPTQQQERGLQAGPYFYKLISCSPQIQRCWGWARGLSLCSSRRTHGRGRSGGWGRRLNIVHCRWYRDHRLGKPSTLFFSFFLLFIFRGWCNDRNYTMY